MLESALLADFAALPGAWVALLTALRALFNGLDSAGPVLKNLLPLLVWVCRLLCQIDLAATGRVHPCHALPSSVLNTWDTLSLSGRAQSPANLRDQT